MVVTMTPALLMLVGAAVTLIALVIVHLRPTGLNPMRDPVSQYGITAYRAWYWTAAGGAALAGVGAALFFSTIGTVIAQITVVLLVVFFVARALIGFFPMDEPEGERTRTGRIHNLLATAAFASVTAAAFTGAGALHDGGLAGASAWSTVLGVLMAVGAVGLLVGRRVRGIFGIAERLIYAGFILWFVMLGVLTLTRA